MKCYSLIYISLENKPNNNLSVKIGELLGLKTSTAIQTWLGLDEIGHWMCFIQLSQVSKQLLLVEEGVFLTLLQGT